MKKTILALCVLSVTVACQKPKKESVQPAAEPAPEVVETAKETKTTSNRISIHKQMKLVHLGQGVAENKALLEKCLKGDSTEETFEKTSVTYKLRKIESDAKATTVNLIAEMVVLTNSASLQNPEINSKARSVDEKEFTKKCGTSVVTKIYKGVRVSQAYQLSKEEGDKVQPLELSAEKSSEFTEAVEKALEGLTVKVSSVKVEGMDASASTKGLKLADAMDQVRKETAGEKSKNEAQVKGKPLEVETSEYPAELKAKALEPKKDSDQGEEGSSETPEKDDTEEAPAGEPEKAE